MPPPLGFAMDSTARKSKVTIHLSDVDRTEDIPDRIVTLEYPDWIAEVGRGSSSDDSIVPQPSNVWYTSKVMSRHHAELSANPQTKAVFVRDKGSTHGTYLNGEAVTASPKQLVNDDVLTFGTRVIRGVDSFDPLKTVITFEWADVHKDPVTACANSFTADYSDVDVYSDLDDEVEIVYESHRQPSVEILDHPFTPLPKTASSSANDSPRSDDPTDITASANTTPPVASPVLEKLSMGKAVGTIQDQTPDESEDEYDLDYDEEDEESIVESSIHPEDDSDGASVHEGVLDGQSDRLNPRLESSAPAAVNDELQLGGPSTPPSIPRLEMTARDPSPSDAAMAKPRFPDPPFFKTYTHGSYDLPRPNDVLSPVVPDAIAFNPPPIPMHSRQVQGSRPLLMHNQYPIDDRTSSDWNSFQAWNPQLMPFQQFPHPPPNQFVDYTAVSDHSRGPAIPTAGPFTNWRPGELQSTNRSISPIRRPQKRKAGAMFDDVDDGQHADDLSHVAGNSSKAGNLPSSVSAFNIPASPKYYSGSPRYVPPMEVDRISSPIPESVLDSMTGDDELNASDTEIDDVSCVLATAPENLMENNSSTNALQRTTELSVLPETPSGPHFEPVALSQVQQTIDSVEAAFAKDAKVESDDEPPRKRIKRSGPHCVLSDRPRSAQSSKSATIAKTIAKGAAIAMAGAAAGAVGTIWTLANLPTNYFA